MNLVNDISPSDSWKKNFRMSKTLFTELVSELRPYISPNPLSPNHRALTVEKKVAVALYYLKDTGSLGMTANTFGIAINTVGSVVVEVGTAISKHLGPKYLRLRRN